MGSAWIGQGPGPTLNREGRGKFGGVASSPRVKVVTNQYHHRLCRVWEARGPSDVAQPISKTVCARDATGAATRCDACGICDGRVGGWNACATGRSGSRRRRQREVLRHRHCLGRCHDLGHGSCDGSERRCGQSRAGVPPRFQRRIHRHRATMQAQRICETGCGRQQLNWLRDIGIVAERAASSPNPSSPNPRSQKATDRPDCCTPFGRSGAWLMG